MLRLLSSGDGVGGVGGKVKEELCANVLCVVLVIGRVM